MNEQQEIKELLLENNVLIKYKTSDFLISDPEILNKIIKFRKKLSIDDRIENFLGTILFSNRETSSEDRFIIKSIDPNDPGIRKHLNDEYEEYLGE